MSTRLFEDRGHVDLYAKFRPVPPASLVSAILNYGDDAGRESAVDLGCGSGQFTRLLAPHYRAVLGTDVSLEQVRHLLVTSGKSGKWWHHLVSKIVTGAAGGEGQH